ncbi:uncharacterized protein LOC129592185 [Paramacrobiotus metropolitanus]|uniref:uncharacterized protein LOC129592185 n=1 Tax=Paramacrobiotus metropolitanus TaxID=2943436 RepID=UPI002445622D|nr:uncharacterized protein LOC129592185 [Paramacrobiotus metropolitanus]
MMGDSAKTLPDGAIAFRPRSNTLQSNPRKSPTATDSALNDTLTLQHTELAAHYTQLQTLVERLEKTQKDCVKRVRHLDGTFSGILHRLPVENHAKSNGDVGTAAEGTTWEGADKGALRDLEEQVFEFQVCLERNLQCVETAMRDLVRRRLRREYVQTQTESTSITARDVALQTSDDPSAEEDAGERIVYALPDLEEAVEHLQIHAECQTDLAMEHFLATVNAPFSAVNRDNVLIIYRNPNIYSFLKPYAIGVGGTALGVVVLYKVVKGLVMLMRA